MTPHDGHESASASDQPPEAAVRVLSAIPGLDGVRGLAVLLVVAFHFGFFFSHEGRPLSGGYLGVDVFFVLSGFLITALLIGEHRVTGSVSFRRFYRRRALRLLPALAVFLAANAIYAVVADRPLLHEFKALALVAFYGANLAPTIHFAMPGELAHTWSLSVEEQFYLLWPLALTALIARGRSSRILPFAIVAGIAASAVIRVALFRSQGFGVGYQRLEARADALLIGALIAVMWHRDRLPRRLASSAASLGLVLLLIAAAVFNRFSTSLYYGGFTVVALAAGAIIVGVLDGRWRMARFFEQPALRAVGRVSYGLYLWHVAVAVVLVAHFRSLPDTTLLALAIVLTAALTTASWFAVEQPFLRLKRRLDHGPGAGPVSPSDVSRS